MGMRRLRLRGCIFGLLEWRKGEGYGRGGRRGMERRVGG